MQYICKTDKLKNLTFSKDINIFYRLTVTA